MSAQTKINRSKEENQRIDRIFKLLFPNLVHSLRKFNRLVENFDPNTPQTTRLKAERMLSDLAPADPFSQRLFLRIVKMAARSQRFKDYALGQLDEFITITKAEAKKDRRYSLLLRLMYEADLKTPLAGSVVTFRHGDLRLSFEIQMNSLAKINKARELRGERKANAVREAFRDTVDYLYTPYIKTLVCLSLIRDGKNLEKLRFVKKMKFGVAIEHVRLKLSDYSQLFDERAAWMRNSIAHEFVPYDLSTDTFALRNSNNNPTLFPTNELLALTEDMYQIGANTAARVGQLYLFRDIFRNTGLGEILLDNFVELACEKDPQRMSEIETNLRKDIETRLKLG